MVARRTGTRRPVAGLVALAWLALIASATLFPAENSIPLPATCVFCGPLGGLDFFLNFVLFVPLGAALQAWRGRLGFATMVGMSVTLVIEVLQWRMIPGRDASLGDLISNTLGTSAGAGLAVLLLPAVQATGAAARRLAIGFAVAASGALLMGGWMMLPASPHGITTIQWTIPRPRMDTYSGLVRSMRLNEAQTYPTVRVHQDFLVDSSGGIAVEAVVRGPSEPTERLAMIVASANQTEEGFFLGQLGTGVVYRTHTFASRLRFRSPFFRLDGVLAPGPDRLDSLALAAHASPAFVRLGAGRGRAEHGVEYQRTAALAWTAFVPWNAFLSAHSWLVNVAWVAALLTPVGFWASAEGGTLLRRWWPGLLPSAALLLGPIMLGLAWPLAVEWLGLFAGLASGAALRRLTRNAIRG